MTLRIIYGIVVLRPQAAPSEFWDVRGNASTPPGDTQCSLYTTVPRDTFGGSTVLVYSAYYAKDIQYLFQGSGLAVLPGAILRATYSN